MFDRRHFFVVDCFGFELELLHGRDGSRNLGTYVRGDRITRRTLPKSHLKTGCIRVSTFDKSVLTCYSIAKAHAEWGFRGCSAQHPIFLGTVEPKICPFLIAVTHFATLLLSSCSRPVALCSFGMYDGSELLSTTVDQHGTNSSGSPTVHTQDTCGKRLG